MYLLSYPPSKKGGKSHLLQNFKAAIFFSLHITEPFQICVKPIFKCPQAQNDAFEVPGRVQASPVATVKVTEISSLTVDLMHDFISFLS